MEILKQRLAELQKQKMRNELEKPYLIAQRAINQYKLNVQEAILTTNRIEHQRLLSALKIKKRISLGERKFEFSMAS